MNKKYIFLLVSLMILGFLVPGQIKLVVPKPKVNISYSPQNVKQGQEIRFNITIIYPRGAKRPQKMDVVIDRKAINPGRPKTMMMPGGASEDTYRFTWETFQTGTHKIWVRLHFPPPARMIDVEKRFTVTAAAKPSTGQPPAGRKPPKSGGLIVVKPREGDLLKAGNKEYQIVWDKSRFGTSYVTIMLMDTTTRKSRNIIIKSPNDGFTLWKIPPNISSGKYRIRVHSSEGKDGYSGVFTIIQPSVKKTFTFIPRIKNDHQTKTTFITESWDYTPPAAKTPGAGEPRSTA